MTKTNSKGFGTVEAVLIFVIIAIIGATGWWVWKSKNNTEKTLNNASNVQSQVSKTSKPPVKTTLKTYQNSEYGYSFKYPSDWTLTVDVSNVRGSGNEGNIYVTSPNGTKVYFGPDFGGKGGDCADDQANDEHTTRTCVTHTNISVDQLKTDSSQPVYLVYASETPPTRSGGPTKFFVYLDSGRDTPKVGSEIGYFLGTWDDIYIQKDKVTGQFVYLTVYVEGKDDAQNGTKDFFNTTEIKEAVPVLESFKID